MFPGALIFRVEHPDPLRYPRQDQPQHLESGGNSWEAPATAGARREGGREDGQEDGEDSPALRAEDPRPVRPCSYRLGVLRGRCRGRGRPRRAGALRARAAPATSGRGGRGFEPGPRPRREAEAAP